MIELLKDELNYTTTENGAISHKTTKSYLLDFFALGGALRSRSDKDIISIFSKSFCENSILTLKCLFYFRDCRNGQGERRTFRIVLKYLAKTHSSRLIPLISHIPTFGRWDDLFTLIGTPLESKMFDFISTQIDKDKKSESPSLLGKWLKSENTSSKDSRTIARATKNHLKLKSKSYRLLLTSLRFKINILESSMSSGKWSKIKYSSVPSKAGLLYRNAFRKHDLPRYESYLESVNKGESKINTSTLYPYEIIEKVLNNNSEDSTLDTLWNHLPDYVQNNESGIVVADVSGSMSGHPMAVSISLAMYMAERNKGPFANHFITFSSTPQLQPVIGNTLREKVNNLMNVDWNMSTNIKSVFNLILNTALKNNVPQSELPSRIFIISDMEFDRCTTFNNSTVFNNLRKTFMENGYNLPELIFWNVNARNTHVPITINNVGVQLVSGCSPILFSQIISGKSAYDLMTEILGHERYEVIK